MTKSEAKRFLDVSKFEYGLFNLRDAHSIIGSSVRSVVGFEFHIYIFDGFSYVTGRELSEYLRFSSVQDSLFKIPTLI